VFWAERSELLAALSVDAATRNWSVRADQPELACASAWSAACRAWWEERADDRLRSAVRSTLHIGAADLATWKTTAFDQRGLIRAHAHVTATRAGVERSDVKRRLVSGTLRDRAVASAHRTGQLLMFPPASDVPEMLATVAPWLAELPPNPFLRAAWIAIVVGAIHPFLDGNGGTGRFLASVELARAWLPPVSISSVQRDGSYIEGVIALDVVRVEREMYETVQRGLATALLAGDHGDTVWDDVTRRRADRLLSHAELHARSFLGPVAIGPGGPGTITRLARRGYRFTRSPRCVQWTLRTPAPAQLELAIAHVVGGGTPWLVAMLGGSLAEDGVLGATPLSEWVPAVFVAAAHEDDAEVDARFGNWLALRLSQCIRGLAAWM
jgi:hypothetical protein